MSKMLVTLSVLVIANIAVGVTPRQKTASAVKPQAEELARQRMEYMGGLLEFPGKGFVAIVNAQEAVSEECIKTCVERFRTVTGGVGVNVIHASFSFLTAKEQAHKDGAAAGVYVVDDANLPMSLVAIEEGWGVVNVAPLKTPAVQQDVINKRFEREFVRVSSLVFGSCRSQYACSPFQFVSTPKDLDKIAGNDYAMDTVLAMQQNLKDLGVLPFETLSYREACELGRAPVPTNELQKAIWEEVRKTPDSPIRIDFDPKRDK